MSELCKLHGPDCMKRYEFMPGAFNFSAWSLDHEPKGPPRFKVGDRVLLVEPLYICHVGNDCDGTPLFAASLDDPASLTPEEQKQDWTLRVSNLSADAFSPYIPKESDRG